MTPLTDAEIAERRADQVMVAAERADRRIAAWRSGMPEYLQAEGETHLAVEAWALSLARSRHPGNLGMYSAENGVGKSWNAWRVPEVAWRAGWDGHAEMVTCDRWLEVCGPPVERAEIRKLQHCGLLILDDLGGVTLYPFQLDALYLITEYRDPRGLPVTFTTNVPKLRDALGERIASRLARNLTPVTFTGEDLRRAQGRGGQA
jgi:DNA replication protein DnaC